MVFGKGDVYGERMMKRSPKTIIVIVLMVIVILGVLTIIRKPSIDHFQQDFGFSLKGINAKTIAYYGDHAFQDPSSIYAVQISGKIEDSVFDPALMSEGIPAQARVRLDSLVQSMLQDNKEPILNISSDKSDSSSYRIAI